MCLVKAGIDIPVLLVPSEILSRECSVCSMCRMWEAGKVNQLSSWWICLDAITLAHRHLTLRIVILSKKDKEKDLGGTGKVGFDFLVTFLKIKCSGKIWRDAKYFNSG